LLTWCVLPTSFPPGVCRRTLPRWRRILPRLGLPFPRLFFLFGDPGLPRSPSSLTPLWYLHSIVRLLISGLVQTLVGVRGSVPPFTASGCKHAGGKCDLRR